MTRCGCFLSFILGASLPLNEKRAPPARMPSAFVCPLACLSLLPRHEYRTGSSIQCRGHGARGAGDHPLTGLGTESTCTEYMSSIGPLHSIARPIAVPVQVSTGAAADIRGRICMQQALFAYWRGCTE
ncbi:hypothetical protein M431DRAFT_234588 [Trichoderma harzianum CBS 226.95]|uniref:Secreted protein n=1 Tax=Trichoderma harzianum CBS 226.95 TaxID=983964 RepID=A0A2T4A219_TRIHA|nr:hypothetical protein M431DRAFT_234588 [Trichoderma harzianum CBS 226.95]PTB51104.1 hypothetical protein M431DRAFT_234588 [Trichoderma harzianum CBS 226.95]